MTEISEIDLTITPRWWFRPALYVVAYAAHFRLITWERGSRWLADYAFKFGRLGK